MREGATGNGQVTSSYRALMEAQWATVEHSSAGVQHWYVFTGAFAWYVCCNKVDAQQWGGVG